MRVLFVDDEAMLLRAIERGIRVRRPAWASTYANSGEEALSTLAAESFDVVVTDVSMPGMDGIRLLGEVRQRYPSVARVVLSGTAVTGAEALVATHQWLVKPCSIVEVCATIERLLWARALIGDDPALAAITVRASLPSPPAVFAQLTRALARPTSTAELAAIVERDAAIAAKLLQLVNTAFFADAERVTSLSRAITLIGSDRLRSIVAAAELFRASDATSSIAERSALVGRIATLFAPRSVAQDASVAGLLHAVGRLVEVEHPVDRRMIARIGGVLLGTWGIPCELVTATAFHDDPEHAPTPDDPLLATVALAVALVDELETGTPLPELERRATALGLDPHACRERVARLSNPHAGQPLRTTERPSS